MSMVSFERTSYHLKVHFLEQNLAMELHRTLAFLATPNCLLEQSEQETSKVTADVNVLFLNVDEKLLKISLNYEVNPLQFFWKLVLAKMQRTRTGHLHLFFVYITHFLKAGIRHLGTFY